MLRAEDGSVLLPGRPSENDRFRQPRHSRGVQRCRCVRCSSAIYVAYSFVHYFLLSSLVIIAVVTGVFPPPPGLRHAFIVTALRRGPNSGFLPLLVNSHRSLLMTHATYRYIGV